MLDNLDLATGAGWAWVGVVAISAAAIAGVALACWRAFGRRFGALTVVLTWAALLWAEQVRWSLWLGQALVVTVFWLFDRGVPGNRHRPVWLRVLAGAVVVTSLVAGVVTVRLLLDPSPLT